MSTLMTVLFIGACAIFIFLIGVFFGMFIAM